MARASAVRSREIVRKMARWCRQLGRLWRVGRRMWALPFRHGADLKREISRPAPVFSTYALILSPPVPDRQPPRSLAGFDILQRLGAGGGGEVFLARSRAGQLVAIKTVADASGDEPRGDAFAREASVCVRLSHPCIVQVRAFLEEPGFAALVFEYVPGVALGRVLQALPGPRRAPAGPRGVAHRRARADGARLRPRRSPTSRRRRRPSCTGTSPRQRAARLERRREDRRLRHRQGARRVARHARRPRQGDARVHGARAGARRARRRAGRRLRRRAAGVAPRDGPRRPSASTTRTSRALARDAQPAHQAARRRIRPDLPEPLVEAFDRALEPEPERRTIGAERARARPCARTSTWGRGGSSSRSLLERWKGALERTVKRAVAGDGTKSSSSSGRGAHTLRYEEVALAFDDDASPDGPTFEAHALPERPRSAGCICPSPRGSDTGRVPSPAVAAAPPAAPDWTPRRAQRHSSGRAAVGGGPACSCVAGSRGGGSGRRPCSRR